ncbi:unnamed protein product, partial [marine sediment metagenome]
NFTEKVLPQLRVPSHFGNMYNASIWAQIIYILENYARVNDTIYFGRLLIWVIQRFWIISCIILMGNLEKGAWNV